MRGLLGSECHSPSLGGEFHRISENVDHDLPQLQVVTDVGLLDAADDTAVIGDPLLMALPADDGVDLRQHVHEREGFIFNGHLSGFNTAHVQNIIDDPKQMMGGSADLFQVLPGLVRQSRIVQGNFIQPDDRVHRRPDLMAHVGQEGGLRPVRLLGCRKGLRQGFILFYGSADLGVRIREAGAYMVHSVSFRMLCVLHSGKTHGFVGSCSMPAHHISIGDDVTFPESFPDRLRPDEPKEFLPVLLRNILVRVSCDGCQIGEALPCLEARPVQIRMGAVADALIFLQFQIVDAPVIGGQGRDHSVLLLPLPVSLQQFFLQGQFLFQFLPADASFGLRLLCSGHISYIHAHAQKTQPSGTVREGQPRCLQVPGNTHRIRNILKEDIGFFHGSRLTVVLHEVLCRHGVEDLMIRQPYHFIRGFFMGIFCK